MKTTERIIKELALTLLLFVALAYLISSLISYRKSLSENVSKEDFRQMQDMKDFHRSQGREIQVY